MVHVNTGLDESCGLPSNGQCQFVSPVFRSGIQCIHMAGPGGIITQFRWRAFFDSELCSVRYGDEFGLKLD